MGITEIIEPYTSRNHSENLLKYFGAKIKFNSTSLGLSTFYVFGDTTLGKSNRNKWSAILGYGYQIFIKN